MSTLFRLFMWRHQRRHLLRAFLGLTSIALGVCLYVSVDVAHTSTVRAFEQSARRMAGKAELRVSRGRGSGIELSALERIEAIEGVAATPVLQKSTTFPDLRSGPVLVLGVDFRREAAFRTFSFGESKVNPFLMAGPGLLVTRSFAERHTLEIGRRLRVNTPAGIRTVHVAGLIDDTGPAQVFDGNLAVMSLPAALPLFSAGSVVDRVDVAPASAADAIRNALGPGYLVEPVQTTNSILEEMLGRIRSLVAISVVAMMVGVFIVYLSVSIGVVERTKEVGTLRALGASRSQVLALFLGEAGVLGIVGSCLGVFLGHEIARFLIDYTADAATMMSLQIHVEEIVLAAPTIAVSIAAGTLASVFAALVPALRATGISPLQVLRPVTYGRRRIESYRRGFLTGAALFAGSLIVVARFTFHVPAEVILIMSVVMLLGFAFMLPQITLWISRLLRRPLRSLFRVEGYLAADNIMKYPERTSLTVIALGGALSIMVTAASVFVSFERSAVEWMDRMFPWDLSVQASDLNQGFMGDTRLPLEVCDRVRNVEGVASAFALQTALLDHKGHDVMVVGVELKGFLEMLHETGKEHGGFRLDDPLMQEVMRGEAVGVSTNFKNLHGVGPGDAIELRTPRGLRTFPVNQHIEDYSWPQGSIVMDLALYRELWNDPTVRYIDLRVEPGRDLEEVKAALGKALEGEFQAYVYSREQIAAIGRDVLAQSFNLIQVQVIIAMIIGFLGIVNTLLISVIRRTREIGLLRAVGMTRGQVAGTVVVESVLVAFVGGLTGVATGLFGAAFPISMHVLRTTGFELGFSVPWFSLLLALGASLLLGFAASYLPARRAAGLNLLEAVGYE